MYLVLLMLGMLSDGDSLSISTASTVETVAGNRSVHVAKAY